LAGRLYLLPQLGQPLLELLLSTPQLKLPAANSLLEQFHCLLQALLLLLLSLAELVVEKLSVGVQVGEGLGVALEDGVMTDKLTLTSEAVEHVRVLLGHLAQGQLGDLPRQTATWR
jgi:hypothetical protein